MNRTIAFTIALLLFALFFALEFAPKSDSNLGLNRVISAATNDAGPLDVRDIGADASGVFAVQSR